MRGTEISWTDNSFSGWHGCVRVSRGCKNCYADEDKKRWLGPDHHLWRRNGPRQIVADSTWAQPLAWNRAAEASGFEQLVFCASMSDVFEAHPGVVEARERLWTLIARTPHLQWQLLTKRPENVASMVPWPDRAWPANVWLGTSVEGQQEADERIPLLLATGARIKFLSLEPLLEAVDLTRYLIACRPLTGRDARTPLGTVVDGMVRTEQDWLRASHLDWLVVGGESAPLDTARPMQWDWASSLVEQAQHHGVPIWVKQLGRHLAHDLRVRGDRDGLAFANLPGDLKVRQMPHGVRRPLTLDSAPAATAEPALQAAA